MHARRSVSAFVYAVLVLTLVSAQDTHAQNRQHSAKRGPQYSDSITARGDDVVAARPVSVLNRLVCVPVADVQLVEALRAIKESAGINLIYRVESIPNRHVTLDSTFRPLGAMLQSLLRNTGLEARQSPAGDLVIGPILNKSETAVAVARLQSVSVLGQQVVAGTMVSTTRREVPNAVTVITGEMMRAQGVRTVDQLFRGLIPGIVAFDQGSDVNAIGTAALQVRGTAGFTALNMPLKTYVDGVEMSDPTFINHIEAKSIDHIEIALGPQASTLYGAGALSGVMQIITKRGKANMYDGWRPDYSATLSMGWLSGKGNSLAPVQDHTVNLSGALPRTTYNLAGGYASDAAHTAEGYSTPASRNVFGTAAARTHIGSSKPSFSTGGTADIDATLRINQRRFGASDDQFYAQGLASGGSLAYNPYRIVPYNRPGTVRERTIGLSLSWDWASWMRHSLVVGEDQQTSNFATRARFANTGDTLATFDHGSGARGTMAYNATLHTMLRDAMALTVTAGADGWQYNYNSLYSGGTSGSPILSPDGGFNASYDSYQRNVGYFAQGQLGVHDQLFFTTGLRFEPSLRRGVGNDLVPLLPRIGVSYVREALGGLSFKVRGSVGKAARPVCPMCQGGGGTPFAIVLSNRDLRGETQTGGEFGFDLYAGRRASFEATYFRQTANDFIVGVRTSELDETPITYEYRNGGKTRNTGVELHGSLTSGPVMFSATYTYTDARLLYAAPDLPGGLRAGDRAMFVAPIATAPNLTYSIAKARLMLGTSYVASYRDMVDSVWSNTPVGGVPQTQSSTTIVSAPSQFRVYANGSWNVADRTQLFIQGDNLNNVYGLSVSRNVAGRRVVFGVRIGQ